MATSWEHNIVDIFHNLQVELLDRKLKEHGSHVDLYFDTADVRRAVLGARQFFDTHEAKFILKEFDSPAMVVDCLLAGGFLRPFRLLPPHQAEFLRQLERDQAFQEYVLISREGFLHDLGIYQRRLEEVRSIREWSNAELEQLVKEQAGNAQKFFKAIQCIKYMWWERLQHLRDSNIFITQTEEFDYPKLVGSEDFTRILNVFDKRRPANSFPHSLSHNNFADAVALVMLIDLTKRFRANSSNRFPRFFDSTGLFHAVAQDSGVMTDLQIWFDDTSTSALVKPRYFLYKATLATEKQPIKLEPIYQIYHEIKDILGQQEPERLKALNTIANRYPELIKIIQDLEELSFLENIWLQEAAADEVKNLVIRLKGTSEEMTSQEFKTTVDSTIDSAKQELRATAERYKSLSLIWIALKEDIVEMRRKREKPPEDVIYELGLFRFLALSDDIKNSGKQIMDGLLSNEIEEGQITDQKVWKQLIDAYFAVKEADVNDPKFVSHVQLVGAVLWMVKAFRKIRRILNPKIRKAIGKVDRKTDAPFFIDLLYAAACFQDASELDRGKTVLDSLMRRFSRGHDSRKLLIRASGIAYLWFHLWRVKDNAAWWRHPEPSKLPKENKGDMLIRNAVEYARKAWEYVSRDLQEIPSSGKSVGELWFR